MLRTRIATAGAFALALTALPVAPAGAHGETPTPTTIGSVGVTQSATTLAVSGAAVFGGQAPVTVAEDPTGDAPGVPDIASTTGVDLVAARMYVPNPSVPNMVIEWQVTGLPETGFIPELTRYSLPFKIGTKEYQIQAKGSNVASVTLLDDPAGNARLPGTFFQLRGNCTTSYQGTGVAACPHLAWLTGEFDVAEDVVRINVPLNSTVAPELRPGAALTRNTSTNANLNKVITGYQAFVALSPQTNDEATFGSDDEETYSFIVPAKGVTLGIAPAGTNPSQVTFGTSATVAPNDSFTGSVNIGGLAAGSYELFAKACFATNCGVASVAFTV